MSKQSKQLPSHNPKTLPPQEVIDLFKTTFNHELYQRDFETLTSEVQQVKSHLYERDYISAFDNDTKRTAYCARWSSSRAISYGSLFAHFPEVSDIIRCEDGDDQEILCIGGGAGAELVAIASIFAPTRSFNKYSTTKEEEDEIKSTLNIHLVDIADWDAVVQRLCNQIEERWLYNDEFSNFKVNFEHKDILKMNAQDLALPSLNLITLLFTTNELFTEQKAESIRFLQNLNKNCQPGCHLLIVESAGSYSHITVGTKKFPIQFLIDTVLVGQRGHEDTGAWSLVAQNDSIWYRCDQNLDYPIKLENMRFFYRLYRKN